MALDGEDLEFKVIGGRGSAFWMSSSFGEGGVVGSCGSRGCIAEDPICRTDNALVLPPFSQWTSVCLSWESKEA